MTCAFGHGKGLLNRSLRCRMGMSGDLCPSSQQARTTENSQLSRYPQRHLLRSKERLPLAATAEGLPALEDRPDNLLMALSEQEDEQGLREAMRQRGSVRLRSDGTADGGAVSPCVRISEPFLQAPR